MRHTASAALLLLTIVLSGAARAAITPSGSVSPDPAGGTVSGALAVGNAGSGSLLVNGGSLLTANNLSLATVAGGSGTVTLDGGTLRLVRSNSLLPSALRTNLVLMSTSTSTANPIAGASATLNLLNGGKLQLDGSVQPTALFGINVGLSGGAGSTGSLLLAGASELEYISGLGFLNVGHGPGHTGLLAITGGSKVYGSTETGLSAATIGRAGGTGTLTLSDPSSLLRLAAVSPTLYIGRYESGAASHGTATVSAGATLLIDGTAQPAAAGAPTALILGAGPGALGELSVAGASLQVSSSGSARGSQIVLGSAGGNGVLSFSGGSQASLSGANSLLAVGTGESRGDLRLTGAGTLLEVSGAGHRVVVGASAGALGLARVEAGATLRAGFVGVAHDGSAATGAQALLSVNGRLEADTVSIAAGGTLRGSGVVQASVINRGVINPGNSPGRLTIDGALDSSGGEIVLEVESDGAGGFLIDELVLDKNGLGGFLAPQKLTLSFLGQTDPAGFSVDLDSFIKVSDGGQLSGLSSSFAPGTSWLTLLAGTTLQASSQAYAISGLQLDAGGGIAFDVTPVPEPAGWALMLLGLGLMRPALKRRPARPARRSPGPAPGP